MRRAKLPRIEEPLVDSSGRITRAWYDALRDLEIDEQDITTSATGGAATLPANPVGFTKEKIGGVIRKRPYYDV